ncbi:MAG: LEA type 2 family protein [Magnetococcus sp. YQC-9]
MNRTLHRIRGMIGHPIMLLLVTGWFVTACGTLSEIGGERPKLEKPRLSLVDVQPAGKGKSSFLEPRLRVRLRVENPNPVELPIGGIECRLELQGMDFATGRTNHFFVIPVRGKTEFDFEVATELPKALKQLSHLMRKKELSADYRLTGHIHVEIPFIGAVPFEKTGTLSKPIRWDE